MEVKRYIFNCPLTIVREDEMAKVELELPEEMEKQLLVKANLLNISLENLIVQSLANSPIMTQADVDPISPLLGTLKDVGFHCVPPNLQI